MAAAAFHQTMASVKDTLKRSSPLKGETSRREMISESHIGCIWADGPGSCEHQFRCEGCRIHHDHLPQCRHRTYMKCTHRDMLAGCARCQIGLEWAHGMAVMRDRYEGGFYPRGGRQTTLAEADDIVP